MRPLNAVEVRHPPPGAAAADSHGRWPKLSRTPQIGLSRSHGRSSPISSPSPLRFVLLLLGCSYAAGNGSGGGGEDLVLRIAEDERVVGPHSLEWSRCRSPLRTGAAAAMAAAMASCERLAGCGRGSDPGHPFRGWVPQRPLQLCRRQRCGRHMARHGAHAAMLAVPYPCAALKKEASLRTAPCSTSRLPLTFPAAVARPCCVAAAGPARVASRPRTASRRAAVGPGTTYPSLPARNTTYLARSAPPRARLSSVQREWSLPRWHRWPTAPNSCFDPRVRQSTSAWRVKTRHTLAQTASIAPRC